MCLKQICKVNAHSEYAHCKCLILTHNDLKNRPNLVQYGSSELQEYINMKEPNSAAHLALIERLKLDPHSGLPKSRQLYLKLYDAISNGVPGYQALLPPTRQLAAALGLGRNTVTQVYEQLASEGLVAGKGRGGTRVIYAGAVAIEHKLAPQLSARAQHFSVANRPVPLSPGEPDAQLFPQRDWARALAQSARSERDRWGYVRDNGHPALRQSIARYLAQYRGLHVQEQQIIVTAGTRQSLILAAMLYGSPGDKAWLEEPGYPGAFAAWQGQGLDLVPCGVDRHGLQIPDGPDPKLIYSTPCFHYPLGITLSAERRQALLQRAAACGAVVFEDDYDSEFRDQVQPRPALASESSAAVLHAGTFSKLIFPTVRLAWLVVPAEHVSAACRALANIGGGHNSVLQLAVAQLLDDGVVARHLSRARQVYSHRRQTLLDCLDEHASVLRYRDGSGGLSLVVDLEQAVPKRALEQSLLKYNLGPQPLESMLWSQLPSQNCRSLVLGLGNVPSMEIPATVQRLRTAIEQVERATN